MENNVISWKRVPVHLTVGCLPIPNAIFGWQTRIHLLHKVFFAIMASHKFITFIFRFTVGKRIIGLIGGPSI